MYQYGNVAVKYQNRKRQLRPTPEPPKQRMPQKEVVRYGLSTSEKLLYLLAVVMVVVTLSLLLAGNAAISQYSYEIQFLEKEAVQVEEMNANLKNEVASLSSPDRIIQYATEHLGLEPSHSTVRVLSNKPNTVRKAEIEQ